MVAFGALAHLCRERIGTFLTDRLTGIAIPEWIELAPYGACSALPRRDPGDIVIEL
jgi:hypothetical protein